MKLTLSPRPRQAPLTVRDMQPGQFASIDEPGSPYNQEVIFCVTPAGAIDPMDPSDVFFLSNTCITAVPKQHLHIRLLQPGETLTVTE